MKKPPEDIRRTISIRLHPKTIAWLDKNYPKQRGRYIEGLITGKEIDESRGFPDIT